ncbi:MAG: 4Fe-4S binding protein [Desulfamplus sp.]|nr:4Fe-4S binding protein [Desulfamplus sp.]
MHGTQRGRSLQKESGSNLSTAASTLFLRIVNVRRICQIFFLALFIWFCITSTVGIKWWQLRGWPVNWLLELDPLAGLATLLSTGTFYKGLLWGVATIILTLMSGRVFCGWICPFGTLHHIAGFLGKYGKSKSQLVNTNRYRPAQAFKYAVLIFFIASLVASSLLDTTAPILTGFLDPIPFVYRFINLTILPFADNLFLHLSANPRYYEGAWIIGTFGVLTLLLNLWIPRFYCRYICPLGALFGMISSISFWQIGKKNSPCTNCMKCNFHCEGACDPMGSIRLAECVMCMNCLDHCNFLTYQAAPSRGDECLPSRGATRPSPSTAENRPSGKEDNRSTSRAGQRAMPEISRRSFVASMISGATAIPMMHLNAATGSNWNPYLVRPPGALPESMFLERCIKCGQCIRICPTNVIQPADILTAGFEGLWTPALNFRIGSSGCQLHCVACGNLCPTGAILPLDLDQRIGLNKHESKGPVRIGTAFVDQGRCLPWAMNRPCIVCQENCPVSPKAIIIEQTFAAVKRAMVKSVDIQSEKEMVVYLDMTDLMPGQYGTGDYFAEEMAGSTRKLIIANTHDTITLSDNHTLPSENNEQDNGFNTVNNGKKEDGFKTGDKIVIQVRLQRPLIDPARCTGCGVCEHECPVKGKRAIRVTAENESRHRSHMLTG